MCLRPLLSALPPLTQALPGSIGPISRDFCLDLFLGTHLQILHGLALTPSPETTLRVWGRRPLLQVLKPVLQPRPAPLPSTQNWKGPLVWPLPWVGRSPWSLHWARYEVEDRSLTPRKAQGPLSPQVLWEPHTGTEQSAPGGPSSIALIPITESTHGSHQLFGVALGTSPAPHQFPCPSSLSPLAVPRPCWSPHSELASSQQAQEGHCHASDTPLPVPQTLPPRVPASSCPHVPPPPLIAGQWPPQLPLSPRCHQPQQSCFWAPG